MNKDTELIFEAYLTENSVRKYALGILCALGLSCANIPDKNSTDEFFDLLDMSAPIIEQLFGDANLSPEQTKQLQFDLEHVLRSQGKPVEGWEHWLRSWKEKNVQG